VLSGDRRLLNRLALPCAGLSMAVLSVALVCGMFFSDKMQGARTKFSPVANHYAYEFYHGRLSESELEEHRKIRAKYEAIWAAVKAAKEAERKAMGK